MRADSHGSNSGQGISDVQQKLQPFSDIRHHHSPFVSLSCLFPSIGHPSRLYTFIHPITSSSTVKNLPSKRGETMPVHADCGGLEAGTRRLAGRHRGRWCRVANEKVAVVKISSVITPSNYVFAGAELPFPSH